MHRGMAVAAVAAAVIISLCMLCLPLLYVDGCLMPIRLENVGHKGTKGFVHLAISLPGNQGWLS